MQASQLGLAACATEPCLSMLPESPTFYQDAMRRVIAASHFGPEIYDRGTGDDTNEGWLLIGIVSRSWRYQSGLAADWYDHTNQGC